MSDTIQVVSWTLGQTCALRSGAAYDVPHRALAAVSTAQQVAEYLDGPSDGFGIWGDVCVTGCSMTGFRGFEGLFPDDNVFDAFSGSYPESGFLISETLGHVGGSEGLRAMCGACPANTSRRGVPAQCVGTLYQGGRSVQAELESIIERLGLADAVAEHFLETTPIWYGLWTKSPLSNEAMRVLRRIARAMLDGKAVAARAPMALDSDVADLRAFARATELAEANGLPLFVQMSKPGHVDLGFHTTFPHCPTCKAEANLKRWQRKYPTELRACDVCGTVYSPAATASSERMNDEHEPDLRQILGQQRFVAFAKEYLVSQGMTAAAAQQMVVEQEEKEERRRKDLAAVHRKHRLTDEYLHAHVFVGLSPVYDAEDTGKSFPRFTATDYAEVLRRCQKLGLRVISIWHMSDDGDMDRHRVCGTDAPEQILHDWRKEGCWGLFFGTFEVPDELLPWPPA